MVRLKGGVVSEVYHKNMITVISIMYYFGNKVSIRHLNTNPVLYTFYVCVCVCVSARALEN